MKLFRYGFLVALFLIEAAAAEENREPLPSDSPGNNQEQAAESAPDEIEPEPEETLIITGSKIEQQPKEITQSVRFLEQYTWERYSTLPFNLSLILQNEPGQLVNPLSRNDANWGSTGGLGPSYSSYLLDGLPVDAFVEGMSLDPWALERVEQ